MQDASHKLLRLRLQFISEGRHRNHESAWYGYFVLPAHSSST